MIFLRSNASEKFFGVMNWCLKKNWERGKIINQIEWERERERDVFVRENSAASSLKKLRPLAFHNHSLFSLFFLYVPSLFFFLFLSYSTYWKLHGGFYASYVKYNFVKNFFLGRLDFEYKILFDSAKDAYDLPVSFYCN